MSDQDDLMPERLKEQARKMRSFLEELDRLEMGAASGSDDAFQLPYATPPKTRPNGFKLTFPA